MKCMEYSNLNHINIIPKDAFEELVQEVFDVIATNISKSLGPLGSSATIIDGSIVEATKDGYSILKRYKFFNRYKKMIYNLIKAPCTAMNNTVGDGTTTAIALTNLIFQKYKKEKDVLDSLYRLPREFTKAWDDIIFQLSDKIKGSATQIDPTDYDAIYKLAYVSSNGNHDIATNIATTYKNAKSPAIKLKDSPTNKSYLKEIEGFEFPANAIDTCFVKNEDLSAKERDVVTMVFDHTIESDTFQKVIIPINDVLVAMNKKFIIIAPKYDDKMLDEIVKTSINYQAQRYGKINTILLQYRTGDLSDMQREDLATVLRSHVITETLASNIMFALEKQNPDIIVDTMMNNESDTLYRCLGSAASIMFSMKNGSIFSVTDIENDEEYKKVVAMAQKDLDDVIAKTDYEKQSFAAKIHDARSRLLQLKMKNFIYYIGADSDLQKQIIHDAVEDVVKCVSSSVKNGTVPGCQISIVKACNELIQHYTVDTLIADELQVSGLKCEILKLIRNACCDLYAQVLDGPDHIGLAQIIKYKNLDCDTTSVATSIITKSVENHEVFDLETLNFSKDVITSAETDIMVLRASSELIKVLISGNQCIYDDHDTTDSQQEEIEMYM